MVNLNKMKNLLLICEGPTEIEFCKKILFDHFKNYKINLSYILILHSNGGIVPWEILKKQIEKHFNDDNEITISTFIDYYGIYSHHKFPNWDLAEIEPNKTSRMRILQDGMKNDIDDKIKFIPYILLHEFETLAFSEYDIFEELYESNEARLNKLKEICDDNPNPETINNSKETAPSKRLTKYIRRFKKTSDSINITKNIGLAKIRIKCPNFNDWITKLENI